MGLCSYQRLFSILILFCFSCLDFSTAIDTITSSLFLKDPQTLSFNGSMYTLGFFSPENSTNRYVGIWYKSKSTVIWVANRNQPLRDSFGMVTIYEDRNLVVLNGEKQVIWSSNVLKIASNSTAQLLNSGNLVLLDNTTGNTLWESFMHPSDTLLQNMKFSTNKKTGEKVKFTSWKSPSDPSSGNFSISLETLNIPELFIWDETQPYWRSGPWNSQVFIGIQKMYSMYLDGFSLGNEGDGTVYLIFNFADDSDLAIFVLNSQGQLEERKWNYEKEEWGLDFSVQKSKCDVYGTCGAFGICSAQSSPMCSCLRGFEPRNREEWNRKNWTNGCVRSTDLQCERVKNGSADSREDGFLKLQTIKVPAFVEGSSASEDNCRSECLKNCSCIAYLYDAGIGCMSWSGNLIDIQQFSSGGTDLYIRLAYSELDTGKERDMTVIITIPVIIGTIMIVTCAYFLWKWTGKHSGTAYAEKTSDSSIIGELSEVQFQELLLYDFEKLATATNNFDSSNKLGQGGFGPVYKGKLQDGREIAVKRLSRASRQGQEEFKNEVLVISKLQHRNLVRLLGCCIERDEKMLIYEYMPNKSLDALVFDPKNKFLDWRRRFNIIEGIARGLLYLHRDSRLRIIHRDLKANNILLDIDLNPKISDFGMARIFGEDEDHANTRRIVGTYGYMAPEYAMEGLFSEKSDVFSFGILLLEIVSGRRNSSFYNNEEFYSLLGFAWKLWNEGNIVTLIDPELSEPGLQKDILRCSQIGLLCVQELARERPSMATVISMLNSEIVNLPSPRQPAFIQRQNMMSSESSGEESHLLHSNNSVSITDIHGR